LHASSPLYIYINNFELFNLDDPALRDGIRQVFESYAGLVCPNGTLADLWCWGIPLLPVITANKPAYN